MPSRNAPEPLFFEVFEYTSSSMRKRYTFLRFSLPGKEAWTPWGVTVTVVSTVRLGLTAPFHWLLHAMVERQRNDSDPAALNGLVDDMKQLVLGAYWDAKKSASGLKRDRDRDGLAARIRARAQDAAGSTKNFRSRINGRSVGRRLVHLLRRVGRAAARRPHALLFS